jgi:glycosyltransferase involved in cell wall biosynthesis
MAQALIERGHQVTMVCGSYKLGRTGLESPFYRGERRGLVNGIEVVEFELPYSNYDNFWRRSLTFLKFSFRSLSLILREECDLIVASSTPLTASIPGIVGRWFLRKPFVFEVRDLWPELPKAMGVIRNPIILSLLAFLEWISYQSAQHCIGLAPGICQGIKRCGIPSERITLVPNGCDLELFKPILISKYLYLTPEIEPDHFVAAFAGAHGLANGLDSLLDTAYELKQRGRNDIWLLFIGDGKCKPSLMSRCKQESLANCIFIDPVSKTRLVEILNQSVDVGLMTLRNIPAFYYGTSPNKFFDYIASGLPVITNYPGWLADLITEHDCGVAVPPDNPEAFADALIMLADNPKKRRHQGENARTLAEKEFERSKLAQKWIQILEEVVSI